MNVGGGEAADQLVRMMLSGGEVIVRLSGSALKNALALSMVLAKDHKTVSGKVNLVKMLRETRDVHRFAMSPEQYKEFRKRAKRQKILFSAIRDSDERGKVVDVILPVTEIERANMIFERIRYSGEPEVAERHSRAGFLERFRKRRPEQKGPCREAEREPVENGSAGLPGEQEAAAKKESRSGPDSSAIEPSSTASSDGAKNERPSVLERLKGYRAQLDAQRRLAPAKRKERQKVKSGKAK